MDISIRDLAKILQKELGLTTWARVVQLAKNVDKEYKIMQRERLNEETINKDIFDPTLKEIKNY